MTVGYGPNVQILTGLASAVAGILTGLISSIVLIILSPQVWSGPVSGAPFPLTNPAIVTVPLGFIACIAGSLIFGRDEVAESTFDEVRVRSTTGIGSDVAEPQSSPRLAGSASS